MTTAIEALRQDYANWVQSPPAIFMCRAILELDERVAGLRDMIRDQLPPRGTDEPEVVPVPSETDIRNAALEEAARLTESLHGSPNYYIASRIRFLKSHRPTSSSPTPADQ